MKSAASQLRAWWPPEAWGALLGGAGATAAALGAAGVSLGLVIGGFVAASLLMPPLLVGRRDVKGRCGIIFGGITGVGGVWLSMMGRGNATPGECFVLVGMLAAYLAMLAAFTVGLRSIGISTVLSSGLTVVLAMAWLTWPVWLPPACLGGGLQGMADVQPVLAANGLLKFTGPWTEQTIAYRLTTLDQDVPIRLPGNPAFFFIFHAGMAIFMAALTLLRAKRAIKAPQPAG